MEKKAASNRQQAKTTIAKAGTIRKTGWPSTSFAQKTTPGFVVVLSRFTSKMKEIQVIIKGRVGECVFGDGERKENHLQGLHS